MLSKPVSRRRSSTCAISDISTRQPETPCAPRLKQRRLLPRVFLKTETGHGQRCVMLEQWVIDRLNPLKGEKLILLADPQRMIRAGAQAVDGWAKETGFTVLFCSGN